MTLKTFIEEMRAKDATFSELGAGIRWLCHEKYGARNGEIYYRFFWGNLTESEKRVQ